MPTSDDARDDWFITVTGKRMFIRDPRVEDIDIIDIAHGLSNICRFGGQCYTFFSVAQHAIFVSQLVPDGMRLTGLLHDATEAYLGDMIRPLKRLLPEYKAIESLWWLAIAEKFGVPPEMPPEIKTADNIALVTERRDLVPPHHWPWKEDERGYVPHKQQIRPLAPPDARMAFMDRFRLVSKEAA